MVGNPGVTSSIRVMWLVGAIVFVLGGIMLAWDAKGDVPEDAVDATELRTATTVLSAVGMVMSAVILWVAAKRLRCTWGMSEGRVRPGCHPSYAERRGTRAIDARTWDSGWSWGGLLAGSVYAVVCGMSLNLSLGGPNEGDPTPGKVLGGAAMVLPVILACVLLRWGDYSRLKSGDDRVAHYSNDGYGVSPSDTGSFKTDSIPQGTGPARYE
jgi:hypothetical protein